LTGILISSVKEGLVPTGVAAETGVAVLASSLFLVNVYG